MTTPYIATLREQRGIRSPRYPQLRNPIYITQPNTLITLLEDAYFDKLPWYYQARTLEESYTGRETPFVWNHAQAEAKRERHLEEQARCKCAAHCSPAPLAPTKRLRRVGKSIVFIVKPKDIPKFGSRRTISSPLTTPSSLDSPLPRPNSVRPKPYSLKMRLPTASFRSKMTGAQAVAGAGLFTDTVRRIRVFQRGRSFVWVIKPAQMNN
ncbi:hypothetical protein B0J17DRAFT_766761 [Rhizoctonia solani]|nr:hypothetical protein B0J17DRAFT_766761 [Rhizoctonia solani]